MAGLAGSFRVLAPDVTKLTATPSGGIGFLAILVVLLASMSAILTPFVSFVFAVLSKGGQRLESGFQWDHEIDSGPFAGARAAKHRRADGRAGVWRA